MVARENATHLNKVAGIWHFYRRVPRRCAGIDSRRFVQLSLETRDRAIAERRNAAIDAAVENLWQRLAGGVPRDRAEQDFEQLIQLWRAQWGPGA
jgi:hypothetical protein